MHFVELLCDSTIYRKILAIRRVIIVPNKYNSKRPMKLNVIVIDDSLVQLALSSNLIKKNKHLNLLGAYSDPFLGLKAANDQDVDVILLDVEMPKIDGFSLQKMLKNSVEVIINSTRASFELQAYINGAIDFLQKPLTAPKINGAVNRVLEMKRILSVQKPVTSSIASYIN